MSNLTYLEQLKPCANCSDTLLYWCGISVRPYCKTCGRWGRVNFGTPADAIKAWNENWERTKARENKLEAAAKLSAEIVELKTTIRTLLSLK
jgi:hypothetical protein